MKHFAVLLGSAALAAGFAGCVSEQVEPQQVEIRKIDGSMVIFKDLYEINSDRIVDFAKARVFPVFNGAAEYLPGDYDINVIVLDAKQTSALYTRNVSQIIYVLAGGGMLQVDGKAYELREGISMYLPAHCKLQVTNNSPYVLKYMAISTPSSKFLPEVIEKAPETPDASAELSDKDLLKKSEAIKGNAATSPTLDQITPVTLEETRETSARLSKKSSQKDTDAIHNQVSTTGMDNSKMNEEIINKTDNITNPPPVKPVEQGAVKSLTPTEDKIMQDK